MSQQDHIQTVKEIYDAVGRGDVDAILERVTDDVDWAADVASNAGQPVVSGTEIRFLTNTSPASTRALANQRPNGRNQL